MWNLKTVGAVMLGVALDRLARWADQSWSSAGFVPAPVDMNEAVCGATIALLIGIAILYLYRNSPWLRRWVGVLFASVLLAFSLVRMVWLWVSTGQSAISEPGLALSTVLFLVMMVVGWVMRKSKFSFLIFPLCMTGYVFGRILDRTASGDDVGIGQVVGVVACLMLYWVYWPGIAKAWRSSCQPD